MNIENLIEGAAFLEQLALKPDQLFDITTFIEQVKHDGQCGTAACALGWMALHGKFDLIEWRDTIKVRDEPICGFRTACHIFEITDREANWLFHGESYRMARDAVTKEMVAARMRWLAGGGPIDNFKEHSNAD